MDSLKDDGTIIIESKVEIPPLVKGKKPREKRKLQA